MKESDFYHWPILGHSQIKHYLQSCINNKTISHAYLFVGPASVGKFLMATHLAATLLCQSTKVKKPCQNCQSCIQLSKNVHADLDIIKREADKKNISIQQIRQLQHKLSLRSFLTSYKIAIIDQAESLNEEASNALLKTLEEPTPQTVIILISVHKDWLPSTIVSRCQMLQFNFVPTYQIENWLIMRGLNKKDANITTHLSAGRPGIALAAVSNRGLRDQREETIKVLLHIINGNLNEKFHSINLFTTKSVSMSFYQNLIEQWLSFFRDLLLYKNNISSITNISWQSAIASTSKKYTSLRLRAICQALQQAMNNINRSINPRLVLENVSLLF